MSEPNWERVAQELAKEAGPLKVAALLKRAYGNTVQGLIAEFDRIALDEQKANDFANNMGTNWWSVTGPNEEYFDVAMDDWQQVVEHIHARYPNAKFPSFMESQAHKSALAGQDPNKKRFDRRPLR